MALSVAIIPFPPSCGPGRGEHGRWRFCQYQGQNNEWTQRRTGSIGAYLTLLHHLPTDNKLRALWWAAGPKPLSHNLEILKFQKLIRFHKFMTNSFSIKAWPCCKFIHSLPLFPYCGWIFTHFLQKNLLLSIVKHIWLQGYWIKKCGSGVKKNKNKKGPLLITVSPLERVDSACRHLCRAQRVRDRILSRNWSMNTFPESHDWECSSCWWHWLAPEGRLCCHQAGNPCPMSRYQLEFTEHQNPSQNSTRWIQKLPY